jgi:hypothetical protein
MRKNIISKFSNSEMSNSQTDMDAQSQNSVHAIAMTIRKTAQKNRIFFYEQPGRVPNRRNLSLDAPGPCEL